MFPCRNLLDGSLTRPQKISRYAVLFVGDGHIILLVLGRFKQFDIFRRGSDAIHTVCGEHCGKGPFVDVYESIHDSGLHSNTM